MMDTLRGKSAKAMDAGDRISGLPDGLCQHILSFLPARDTVRTCILSLKWCHLWTSVRCLNVDAQGFSSHRGFVKFVNALLLSRACTPLESFWLRANGPDIFLENFRETAYLWIRHALKRNVEELGIIDHDQNDTYHDGEPPELFQLHHCPITSSYLKKLHLCYVEISNHAMKNIFSGCPALEDLETINCRIIGAEFSSATLKNLSISYVHFPVREESYDEDIVINMHSLVSLHIGALHGGAMPYLVDVQSLITASIYLDSEWATFDDICNTLGALSNVKNLEMLLKYGLKDYSLQSDMQLCQVAFTNLTTLSLSDWCLHDNCKALLYLLEHSPKREPFGRGYLGWSSYWATAVDIPCEETMKQFTCGKLKKIQSICTKGDKTVGKLVSILLAKIISPLEISIKSFSGLSWVHNFDNCWTPY